MVDKQDNKILNGQFYTIGNPFDHVLVKEWVSKNHIVNKSIVEPFAGGNNIVRSFQSVFPEHNVLNWKCYDIDPEAISNNVVPELPVEYNDSIKRMPSSSVIITNPPYLAKNSAKRLGLKVDFKKFNDLWELSVNEMLEQSDYVAAIIPESFLTRNIFQDRLYGVISLTESLFNDTEFPVCLALWGKERTKDFLVYVNNNKIGFFKEKKNNNIIENIIVDKNIGFVFNDPEGSIGIYAVDGTGENKIRFCKGNQIDPKIIKNTSRAITRITLLHNNKKILFEKDVDVFITLLNNILEEYRTDTGDIFLTNFKSLNKSGVYRRRLDWKKAKKIIYYCYTNKYLTNNNNSTPKKLDTLF